MPAGGNPIETGSNEERIAQLETQVAALLSRNAFLTGDYLDSERAPAEFLAGVLDDGGRPGWWLANGATFVHADDPALKELLNGATTLPDYRGRVRVPPNGGATFAARGTLVGAVSTSVALASANLPPHVHAAGTLTISPNPHSHGASLIRRAGAGDLSINSGSGHPNGSTDTTSLTIGGSTGSVGSGTAFSVDTIQPTRTCGATWIKR